jgi:hypothetical protein
VKPHLGLKLGRGGLPRNMDLVFYDFVMFSLSVLGARHYSATAVGCNWRSTGYDGDQRELWAIPEVREFVRLLDGSSRSGFIWRIYSLTF